MVDKYKNFNELSQSEQAGTDFVIDCQKTASKYLITSIHGGAIEPGTSEIAKEIANEKHNLYSFEGRKCKANRDLHITSTNFDEIELKNVIETVDTVISIHGRAGTEEVVYLGGLDHKLRDAIREKLESKDFTVKLEEKESLRGNSSANICNGGKLQKGVQLEISNGLREKFFEDSLKSRKKSSLRYKEFCDLIREVIDESASEHP